MRNPLISCIIPTFNRSNLIKDAIESTIDQTYPYWELIIIDDWSTDKTEQVVDLYLRKDNRIKYYKNPGKGGNAARNCGIDLANGEWIAFLDDDDVSLPQRFEKQINAGKITGGSFISSWFYTSNSKSDRLRSLKKEPLYGFGDGLPSRWLIKKDLLIKAGGFDEKQTAMQDNELSYRVGQFEKYIVHREYVSIINNTPNSLSRNKEKAIQGKLELLEKCFHLMPPFEYATWCYSLAKDYVVAKDYEEARRFYRVCSQNDSCNYYKLQISIELALIDLCLINVRPFNFLIKVIRKMKRRFPLIVDHIVYP